MSSNSIQYLRRGQIDDVRWDACIEASHNGLIYGYTDYLDHLAERWDALVLGNYEAVMPLPWKRKYGFRYLYQPPFIQQLGIISPTVLPAVRMNDFLVACRSRFRFAEVFLNFGNTLPALRARSNFILQLGASYEEIRKGYRKGLLKSLKVAARHPLSYHPLSDPETVIQRYRKEYGSRMPHVKDADYNRFAALCRHMLNKNDLVLRGVNSGGHLLTAALLFRRKSRLYLLQTATPGAGRAASANHFLLDHIIREFAGHAGVLDFEGSDIPGIAHFYRSFGTIGEPYYFFRFNALPLWCRWLKG